MRTPTTWTVTRYYGPNHLGLWCNALPEHQMALITSDCVPFRLMWPRLEQWQAWFLASQHAAGPGDAVGYQWRGRDAGDGKLNAMTLASVAIGETVILLMLPLHRY